MISEYFTNEKYPNCKIQIDDRGLILSVSLNITPVMKKYLCSTNVFKGEKHFVYVLKKRIDKPNKKKMKEAYDLLMRNLKTNHRVAKIKVLADEIGQINS